jgi:hypothetical protein
VGQDYATRSGGEQIQSGELRIDIERPHDHSRSFRGDLSGPRTIWLERGWGRQLLRDAAKCIAKAIGRPKPGTYFRDRRFTRCIRSVWRETSSKRTSRDLRTFMFKLGESSSECDTFQIGSILTESNVPDRWGKQLPRARRHVTNLGRP